MDGRDGYEYGDCQSSWGMVLEGGSYVGCSWVQVVVEMDFPINECAGH